MGMYAFRRMRARNEAAQKAASLTPTLEKPKPKPKPKKVKLNGDNSDATVGGANANTYITLADANSFIEGLVLSDDAAAWDGSSNDNKNRALFTAAQRIDREKFLGARVDDTQALEWPRSGVRKPDTYTNLYGLSFPNRLVADYYTDTEIPDRVKNAQVILAVYLNNNRNGLELSGLEDFATVSIGI